MKYTMQNRMFEYANRVVRNYGTRDPFDLIENRLRSGKLIVTYKFEPDGLKGFATIQNQTRYVVVNGYLCPEEQRVVAGHELAHIFLHDVHLRAEPMEDLDIYNAMGKLERESNSFAADFLISDDEALDVIHSCDTDFFGAARQLRIPAAFFAFKLYSLIQRGNKLRMPVDLDSRFLASGK